MKRKISSIIVVGIMLFQSLSAYPFVTEAKENEQKVEINTPSKTTKGLTNSLKFTKTILETGDTYENVFPDSALAKVIAKEATGSENTTQLVTQADLNKITSLNGYNKGISVLTGIDLLVNVTSISLNNNQITDISPIDQLPNLVSLSVKNNQISSLILNAQNQLPKLTTIDIENNPDLNTIDIQDQPQLVNVKTSGYTGLRKLTTVIAKNNPELVNLGQYTMRNVYFSQVASLTKVELVNLPKVRKANLDKNSINELKVTDLAIENLPLGENELTDTVFDNIQNLPNLKTLDLSENQLEEVVLDKTDVENLPNLMTLNIQQNLAIKLINVQDQPQLVDVKTSDYPDLSALTTVIAKNNPELVNLGYYTMRNVYFSQIASLTKVELANLPKVTVVRFERNSIDQIELNNLVSVTDVNLNTNKINSIEKFKNIPILATLNLNKNQITNIDMLDDFPEMTTLNIDLNSISVLPSNLKTKMPKLSRISALNQAVTLDKAIVVDDSDLIINNEISNFDKLIKPLSISNFGTYANEKITWPSERIKNLTEVSFQFSELINVTGIDGTFSGKVTQPFKRSTTPVINADSEIHYPQGTEKTEAEFLKDVQAQTTDDLAIKSDFETMVNLKKVGKYTVTLNVENMDGIKATPKEVTVYIDAVQGANITVKYEDESGNKLAENSILTGNVGEEYSSSAKEILGYTLTEMPSNAQGEFSLEEQTVTYIYSKNPVPAKDITVQYTDEDGMELAPTETLSGNVDENYVTTAKTFTGYELIETPSNAEGKFSENAQTVTYVYRAIKAEPILAKEVTVNYQDELGAKISETEVLTGEIGETYTTVAKTIDGYTLIKSPTNANGIFNENSQTVTYVYQLQNSPIAANITVKHLDENNNELAPSEVLSGNVDEAYTTKPKEIKDYSLVKVPTNASGKFTTEAQTVIYHYKKNSIPTSSYITVKYVDETGKELAISKVLNGNINDSYATTAKEIKGYTLVKKPTNATGKFTDQNQTIKYVYRANKAEVNPNPNSDVLGSNSNGDIQPTNDIKPTNDVQPTNEAPQTLPKTGSQPANLIFGLGILLVLLSTQWLHRNKRKKAKSHNC
ncbi:MucBP domain-containing protein [Listeria innocua]|uniref:MucBP domain-containing protein n=1 Tax=Listeria innocua TaxID=1642 RepID=UPI00086D6CAE|nr:MucBP domain-containing protein [Listeria innocua]MDG0896042.1 MucBP domain-containing protein [Listeria innocua]MDH4592949.1 MucBP domain-containing protein [Listeria innocua]OEO35528.1 cell surface protein [Listeria monocytogenes]UVW25788.1 MucBP domain-containing protein [Listeria innocua]